MLRIETLRNALHRWSQDPAMVQTLRAGWAIELPGEIFTEALASGRGLAINVTAHKVLLQLKHGSQSFEFAIPIAALTEATAFEKWLRAIRMRAEQSLCPDLVSTTRLPPGEERWEPVDDRKAGSWPT